MIFDRDPFARLALYPKFISTHTGAFDEAFLIKFSPGDKEETWFALSVANRSELKVEADVHAYGCRAAAHADKDFETRNKRPPNKDTEANYYVGFYDFEYGAARNAPVLWHDVRIRWKPENGENAHFQIEMHRRPNTAPSGGQLRKDRVAMRVALAMGFRGPKLHVDDREEPTTRLTLEEMAAGLPTLPAVAGFP